MTTGWRRWYVVEAYVQPSNTPIVAHVEQEIGQAKKLVEGILLGELNVRLQEPRDAKEEELAPVVSDY